MGGTRIEAETGIYADRSYAVPGGQPSSAWVTATSPAGYSGTGFASNEGLIDYLTISIPPMPPGYYEISTHDITGGSGASRGWTRQEWISGSPGVRNASLGNATWSTHNDWGDSVLGAWRLSGEAATMSFGPPWPPGTAAGYLGVDWFDVCPVADPSVAVHLGNLRNEAVQATVTCEVDGVMSATSLTVPALTQTTPYAPGPVMIVRPLAATCAFAGTLLSNGSAVGLMVWVPGEGPTPWGAGRLELYWYVFNGTVNLSFCC